MTKRIVLCSWGQLEGNYSNMGDKLIFETQLELLQGRYQDLKLFCMSGDPKYTRETYAIEATNPFTISGFFALINYIRLCDLVIIGGGELIQDKSSKMYLLFNLFPIWVAKLFRKKCIALAIGISSGDELSSFGAVLAKSLHWLDACSIRDEISFKNAQNLNIQSDKLFLSSDIVFSSKRYCSPENNNPNLPISIENDYIVISLRNILGRRGRLRPFSIGRKFSYQTIENNEQLHSFLNQIIKTINSLVSKLNMTIILWPTYFGKQFSSRDDLIHKYIYEHVDQKEKVQKLDAPMSFEQIYRLLKSAQLLIGTPLHSLIMATIAHCPFFGINYAQKGDKFIQQLDYPKSRTHTLTSKEKLNEITEKYLYNAVIGILEDRSQIKQELENQQKRLIQKSEVNLEILDGFLKN